MVILRVMMLMRMRMLVMMVSRICGGTMRMMECCCWWCWCRIVITLHRVTTIRTFLGVIHGTITTCGRNPSRLITTIRSVAVSSLDVTVTCTLLEAIS